ncbi:MAG: hypothetical protein BWZ03_00285 [bacterium ADurb.BinA186]|nr:MAG: hypothetical protein BWZ03_00285 [bacterium ADurb.BinA186]
MPLLCSEIPRYFTCMILTSSGLENEPLIEIRFCDRYALLTGEVTSTTGDSATELAITLS